MDAFQGRIADLVHRLDSMREPTLTHLADALKDASLSLDEVAAFIKETSRGYHRALVVRRDQYELLILTWAPGQGSAPHDHAGSISAMQVLEGEALEGSWRIEPDGYVVREFEKPIGRGELTAWQDAGVHTIRNGSSSRLVTVHVYAPPLKDFRRFVPRPETIEEFTPSAGGGLPTVLVVGGGFSGSMTAAQLLHRSSVARKPIRVCLVERQGAVGEGLAYSTGEMSHLLNVPAAKMSAWPDRPNDFMNWAAKKHRPVAPTEFLPRRWYGEYIRETLTKTARDAQPNSILNVVFDEVRRLTRRPGGGWMVNFARGISMATSAVVIAVGHRPPSDPIGKVWSGQRTRFIADPWRPFATNAIGPDDPVVILGSGLTAMDAVLSLTQETRKAPITLISRRGLLPHAHADAPVPPADMNAFVAELLSLEGSLSIRAICNALRQAIGQHLASGGDWRSVIDGLRPHTASLWGALPERQRRLFLAHMRSYWEIHRHRMAVNVGRQIHALRQSGVLNVLAGSVAAVQAEERGVRLFVRQRGESRLLDMRAAWVINCTGPAASNSAESNPAIGSLLVHGLVRQDKLALGLDTTEQGNCINEHGEVVPDLLVVGTLRKPAHWESTAVPELRAQASAVAEAVLAMSQFQTCATPTLRAA